MHDSLFQLTPPDLNGTIVTVEQVKRAVEQLPGTKKRGSFSLPGRQCVNANSTDSPQHATHVEQAQLDYVVGTRIDLLSEIQNALLEASYVVCPSVSGSAPAALPANFPTIQEYSKHWTLNEKQHLAFVLIAAALLEHICEAKKPDGAHIPTRMGRMSTDIDALLQAILPPSGQLVLYLGGSGGTGKSRIIQAFVDFARRSHSMSSHVTCASSCVAAILIGGCTLHTALGIGIQPRPPKPNNNHIQAWPEIGVMFLDEFSMVKPALYSLTNS